MNTGSCPHGGLAAVRRLRPLLWLVVLAAFGLSACGGGDDEPPPPPGGSPSRLIAADAAGVIYQINPSTGSTTALGNSGVVDILSMAYSRPAGTVFAGTTNGTVYTVNADSGAVTPVTFDDQTGGMFGWHTGMAAHPTTGHVFVVRESECSDAFSFDPATSIATNALNNAIPDCYSLNDGGFPLAFDGADNLYLINNYNDANTLYRVDIPGDTSASVGAFTFAGFPTPGSEGWVNAITVRPEDGKLYVTTSAGEFGVMEWLSPLTINHVATLPAVMHGLTAIGGGRPPYPPVRGFSAYGDQGSFGSFWAEVTWQPYPVAETVLYWSINDPGIDPADPASYAGKITGLTTSPYQFSFLTNTIPNGATVYFRIAHVVGGQIVALSAEEFVLYSAPVG